MNPFKKPPPVNLNVNSIKSYLSGSFIILWMYFTLFIICEALCFEKCYINKDIINIVNSRCTCTHLNAPKCMLVLPRGVDRHIVAVVLSWGGEKQLCNRPRNSCSEVGGVILRVHYVDSSSCKMCPHRQVHEPPPLTDGPLSPEVKSFPRQRSSFYYYQANPTL